MKTIACLTALLLSPLITLHAAPNAAKKSQVGPGDDAPAGKAYTYKESAGKPRRMEIYFPPNHDPSKAKVPGVILFHGGGWGGGTLMQFRNECAYFASRGLVCATAEYQMLSNADAKNCPLAYPGGACASLMPRARLAGSNNTRPNSASTRVASSRAEARRAGTSARSPR